MTALAKAEPKPQQRPWLRREAPWLVPVAVGALDALVFAAVAPLLLEAGRSTPREPDGVRS